MTMTAGGPTARFDAQPGTVEYWVWRLIRAADAMRDHWAESDEGRRGDLWYDLHDAADNATTALEEGPEAAERAAEAERRRREAARREGGG